VQHHFYIFTGYPAYIYVLKGKSNLI